MKRKKTINILGYIHTIEYPGDGRTMDADGRFQGDKLNIQIATGQSSQHEESVMLHEIIEAINWHLALNLDHSTITQLETGLYQTLTQNGVSLCPLLIELERET